MTSPHLHQLWSSYFNDPAEAEHSWERYRRLYEDGNGETFGPCLRDLRRGFMTTAYATTREAAEDQAALNVALGMTAQQAVEAAITFCREYEYALPGRRMQSGAPQTDVFKRVKAAVPIGLLAERLTDIRWNGEQGRGRCPLHGGDNPTSFSVNSGSGLFRCFVCGAGGDVVELQRAAMEKGIA